MIYLEQTTEEQVAKIPRNLMRTAGGGYVLTLENTLDRSRISMTPLCVTASALNYTLSVALPDLLPAGEYSYELRQGAAVVAVGVLTLGAYKYDNTQYEAGQAYEQYANE